MPYNIDLQITLFHLITSAKAAGALHLSLPALERQGFSENLDE